MSADTHLAEVQTESPFAVGRARVHSVVPVSQSFVRVTFVGEHVDRIGTPGTTFDQRVKLVFPGDSGTVPELADSVDWYQQWLAVPEDERGSMRTYSIRDVRVGDDGSTELVIDFVLHLKPGLTGPASSWASTATEGDEVLLIAPRRGRFDGGGIEYAPGRARAVLLAGDETAAPAIARILEDCPRDVRGSAFIEIPTADDELPFAAPDGVDVHWLVRDGAEHGAKLRPAVLDHLAAAIGKEVRDDEDVAVDDDSLVWETPTYSGAGEDVDSGTVAVIDRYYWIAGESKVVTGLRRHLVKDLGIARAQVAFMGYWRHGVAMA
ncbi:siderophore-interacting protein [Gordonia zhaorongruii]|uniref:siderophore-interacting protein n=1 Tax=Gordonia zhaorongruii TaxID=2597659 RepID=UPI00104AB2A7|nr:siderophore-interacting protein [Gordonia zhaorongruii]